MNDASWDAMKRIALACSEKVADLLHCSKEHVEDLAEQGRLPATKIGRAWIFVTAKIVEVVLNECIANAGSRSPLASSPTLNEDKPTPVH
jgi:excisionase family DNA binding protein